jgi:hypothetical protein
MGWATWIALLAAITIIAWVIAEAIPFFSDLLSISSSLFISGFTYYFPAIFWFVLLKEGSMFDRKNLVHLILSSLSMIVGLVVLVGGTYASVVDIVSVTSYHLFDFQVIDRKLIHYFRETNIRTAVSVVLSPVRLWSKSLSAFYETVHLFMKICVYYCMIISKSRATID